jgi:hypothetical protein
MTNTKAPALLTIPQATKQARRHVDKLMPGVGATVESKLSHDLDTDTPTVITVVTFPHMHSAISELRAALHSLPGIRDMATADSSIRFTRTR